MSKTSKHLCSAPVRLCFLAVAGLIAAQPFVVRVEAANMYWAAAAGGDFDDPGNWATTAGGSPPAGPPDSGDQAYFNVPGPPYLVTFSSSPTNTRMLVWDSDVSFNLAGNTYFLSHISDSHLSYVGYSGGTAPCVATFSNGILKTSSFVVTGVADAPGKLVFTGADTFWQHVDPISSANTIQDIRIGNNAGGEGRVELRNGASAELQSIRVGYIGSGALLLAGGATTDVSGALSVAYQPGSSGRVELSGAGTVLTNSGYRYIGMKGEGSVRVSDGAEWQAGSGAHFRLGSDAAGTGTVTISGAGACLKSSSSIQVGYEGTGALIVTNGGSANFIKGTLSIGERTGSHGRLVVSGTGSVLFSGYPPYIGNNGKGQALIDNGAEWTSEHNIYIGYAPTGDGALTVSGGAVVSSVKGCYLGGIGEASGRQCRPDCQERRRG